LINENTINDKCECDKEMKRFKGFLTGKKPSSSTETKAKLIINGSQMSNMA
jgi:hypothetical protein